jgi:hypothetical protein
MNQFLNNVHKKKKEKKIPLLKNTLGPRKKNSDHVHGENRDSKKTHVET